MNDHCQQLTSGSLEDYVSNKYSESNWLTRMLTNKMSGRVDEDDLNDAKRFIEMKCLIGLTDMYQESYERVEKYFGWINTTNATCENELKLSRRLYDENISNLVYDQLHKQNELDINLYEFAMDLYEKQTQIFK